jgi:hypothetical protein
MSVRSIALTVVAAGVLAGCQTTVNRTADIQRSALPGSTINLAKPSSVNPDCSSLPTPRMLVVQAPAQGALSAAPGRVYPGFPASNVRSRCNSTAVRGLVINYTARPGSSGSDYFTYDIIFSDGEVWRRNVSVTIR